jgi:hypothetical protein
MASTIACDSFTWFCVFVFVLWIVAAVCTRGDGRCPTGVIERDVDRPPARPDRIADRIPGRLPEPGPGCGRTFDIPGLDAYARQFEEAIEKIWLRRQDFRQGK